MNAHPVICDCEDCINRGGGVRLDQLKPRLGVARERARVDAKRAKASRRSAENARAYLKRKLRGAAE